MLSEMAGIVVDWVGAFFVIMLLVRFHFQWLRVPFRNQTGEFIMATTNWMVMPARRVVPTVFGLDLASWICAWMLQALVLTLLLTLTGRDLSSAPGIAAAMLFAIGLVDLVQYSIKILLFILILQAVLSWVNPHHPMQFAFDTFTKPFLRPIRRFLPPIANVDLSPMVLMLALFLMLVPIGALHRLVGGMF